MMQYWQWIIWSCHLSLFFFLYILYHTSTIWSCQLSIMYSSWHDRHPVPPKCRITFISSNLFCLNKCIFYSCVQDILPGWKWPRSIWTLTVRLCNSLFPQAVRLLTTQRLHSLTHKHVRALTHSTEYISTPFAVFAHSFLKLLLKHREQNIALTACVFAVS